MIGVTRTELVGSDRWEGGRMEGNWRLGLAEHGDSRLWISPCAHVCTCDAFKAADQCRCKVCCIIAGTSSPSSATKSDFEKNGSR